MFFKEPKMFLLTSSLATSFSRVSTKWEHHPKVPLSFHHKLDHVHPLTAEEDTVPMRSTLSEWQKKKWAAGADGHFTGTGLGYYGPTAPRLDSNDFSQALLPWWFPLGGNKSSNMESGAHDEWGKNTNPLLFRILHLYHLTAWITGWIMEL